MNQNPTDPPTLAVVNTNLRKSRRAYWVASTVVVGLFAIAISVLAWVTTPTVDDGYIWFSIPGESISTSPFGDPLIAYERMIYTSVGTAITLLAVLFAMSLAIVNGLVLFWQRRGRPT